MVYLAGIEPPRLYAIERQRRGQP